LDLEANARLAVSVLVGEFQVADAEPVLLL
jgi:hypothetical protein